MPGHGRSDHGALTELAIKVGPGVRIRLAPAESQQTFGSARLHTAIGRPADDDDDLSVMHAKLAVALRQVGQEQEARYHLSA
jgi:hypothetical protein